MIVERMGMNDFGPGPLSLFKTYYPGPNCYFTGLCAKDGEAGAFPGTDTIFNRFGIGESFTVVVSCLTSS